MSYLGFIQTHDRLIPCGRHATPELAIEAARKRDQRPTREGHGNSYCCRRVGVRKPDAKARAYMADPTRPRHLREAIQAGWDVVHAIGRARSRSRG